MVIGPFGTVFKNVFFFPFQFVVTSYRLILNMFCYSNTIVSSGLDTAFIYTTVSRFHVRLIEFTANPTHIIYVTCIRFDTTCAHSKKPYVYTFDVRAPPPRIRADRVQISVCLFLFFIIRYFFTKNRKHTTLFEQHFIVFGSRKVRLIETRPELLHGCITSIRAYPT